MLTDLLIQYRWTRNETWEQYITKGNEVITNSLWGEFLRGTFSSPYLGKIDNVRFYPTLEAAMIGPPLPPVTDLLPPGLRAADCCFHCRYSYVEEGNCWCREREVKCAPTDRCEDFE